MKRTNGKSKWLWAMAVAASAAVGCVEKPVDTGEEPGTSVDPTVQACKDAVSAKRKALENAGVNVAAWSYQDPAEMAELTTTSAQTAATYESYDGHYRPLSNHPGCSKDNLYYDKKNTSGSTPYVDGNRDGKWTSAVALGGPNQVTTFPDGDAADLPGFPCAAKEYAQPSEDTTKPIVLLVHGNSTRPHTWEQFLLPPNTTIVSYENTQFVPDSAARPQLADSLVAKGYKVYAVDFRTDLVTAAIEPMANNTSENQAGNIDHGWATPIAQAFIKAAIAKHPGRKFAIIGHSLGVTVARDALRRMYVEFEKGVTGAVNPFPHIHSMVLASGANHGVSTYDAPYTLCAQNKTMRGTIVCEMGSRTAYTQTYFHKALNGPDDLFATPCADGEFAFGKTGVCGGNVIKYYTITMTDKGSDKSKSESYQDLYVSEAASAINMAGCVTNKLTTLNDYDTSGYFFKGMIANHFGSARSTAGVSLVMEYLAK